MTRYVLNRITLNRRVYKVTSYLMYTIIEEYVKTEPGAPKHMVGCIDLVLT